MEGLFGEIYAQVKYMVDTDGKTDIDFFNSIHQCKEAESHDFFPKIGRIIRRRYKPKREAITPTIRY